MKTIFSTAEVHPRDRFDFWYEVACKNIIRHKSTPDDRYAFHAELQSAALAEVDLCLFENAPMSVSHAPWEDDRLIVGQQLAGTFALEQNSREVLLRPGDVTLVDPRLPWSGKFFPGSKFLLLKIPRRALEARVGKTSEMLVRAIRPEAAENRLTSAFLALLPTCAGELGPVAEELVKDQALDLIAVSLAKTMESMPHVSSARALAAMNVRAAVESRLADPALDPDTVAAAAGISIRYANAALAQEGTSIGRLIQERRLARCRRALEDPLQAHRTVSEIAYGWGFSDMTHFGRRFRAAFGLLPSDYRRACRASQDDLHPQTAMARA
ncbi:AraC-like ligand-binding domain-containing protein [Rhodopila globiformis]|uniref:AraC-like ligand-binding domain-containing protein n=1 Tax=Rhodopila globiformis TaxID=1071 RepID=UPI001304BC83|nr:helix-turn-helix domain-containing protein [Rhodopila globiformis]